MKNTFKIVDSRCHQLTAPHVREKHQNDSQVNIIKPVVATLVTIASKAFLGVKRAVSKCILAVKRAVFECILGANLLPL